LERTLSEAQAEEITVADIDEHPVRKDIPTDQAMIVLALERGFDNRDSLDQNLARKKQAHGVFKAGDIYGRGRINACHSNGIEVEW
jgi:hypothetical protein